MARPLRILRVISRLNVGGPARQVLWLARDLRARGWETTVVAGTIPRNEDSLEGEFDAAGIPITRFPEMEREIDFLRDGRAAWRLRRLVRDSGTDLVHAHLSKAAFLVRAARVLSPGGSFPPVVYTHHGNRLSGYFSPWKQALVRGAERALAPWTEAFLVLSPQQREEIAVRIGIGRPSQYRVVPLGTDLGFLERLDAQRGRLRAELGVAAGRPIVGIVGRVAPIKDHATFVDAAARVLADGVRGEPPFFVVVGAGSEGEMESLRKRVAEARIGAHFRFLGTRKDPAAFLADLDVVALTSRNEGTPLARIEARASGMPIVATDVGGVADLLTREWAGDPDGEWRLSAVPRGVLVPPGDPRAFADALRGLLDDPARRAAMGRASRDHARRSFSLDRLTADLDRVYRDVLGAVRPAGGRAAPAGGEDPSPIERRAR